MIRALAEAASITYELEDLINVAIEQLVRLGFELPAFRHPESGHTPRRRHTHTRALRTRLQCSKPG